MPNKFAETTITLGQGEIVLRQHGAGYKLKVLDKDGAVVAVLYFDRGGILHRDSWLDPHPELPPAESAEETEGEDTAEEAT
jgi:hypothetical protein